MKEYKSIDVRTYVWITILFKHHGGRTTYLDLAAMGIDSSSSLLASAPPRVALSPPTIADMTVGLHAGYPVPIQSILMYPLHYNH